MKKVWRGFAAAVSAAAIAATGFIGATSANADEATVTPTPGAITIKNPIEGDQFKAYQLLGVTIDDSAYAYKLLGADNAAKIDNPATKALVNAINSANATAELDLDTDTDGKQTTISIPTQRDDNTVNTFEQKLVKAISIFTGDSNMRLFAQELAKQVATQNVPVAGEATADENTGNALVIKGEGNAALPIGYYLVDHVDQANTGNRTLSAHLVNTLTAAGAVLDLKTATVEFEKKVEDWNESLGDKKKNSGTIDSDAWQDSADHKLRDEVPFMLKGSLPSNYANYDVFQYQFSDTLSEGLTLKKDSINVQLVNFGTPNVVVKNLTADEFQVVLDAKNNTDNAGLPVGATKFTVKVGTEKTQGTGENAVTIRDLKGVTSTKNSEGKIVDIPNFSVANTKIVVTYKARVNKKAVIGTTGNPNKANLSISENPDNGWDGLISTPKDIVIVFTYKYTVNKTFNGRTTNVPAQLPSFLLEKFIPAKNGTVNINGTPGNWDRVAETQVDGNSTNGYTASFSHLDDGYYKLSETNVPAGYNPAADKFFTVTAEHEEESDNPQLTKLTVTYYTDASFGKVSGNPIVTNKPADGTIAGTIDVTIDNKSGNELPSTGGMGTTILYAAGAAIVLIAGIGLAVTLRRRQA
ncbi:Gram-positive pilin backbone subunit 2, Cna-B-like domain-containing protein [Bifidobacterium pseudolongum subsp. globosum]|uniref:isopeptide-forming domain-containing fimbrial protein n=1 Tax=Bifidobacterium pseudolongum TaxID=1694 RepID=UPI00101EF79C|nr:isopeptide-forming domain-containing fimbrial protein [Bifidobacterium pseudolongum]RYQ34447.1 Gram-positive pilin backbone subunit 2, Cna-B-like domain-containing protein [Bifidobacterium pseudolongum subsp. globosum]